MESMKKNIVLFVLCLSLIVGTVSLHAQSGHQGAAPQQSNTQQSGTQQEKPMTKEELRDAIAHAHHLVNLYIFRYGRKGASDREYKAYVYWHNRRQELLKQYNEMQ